jgi:hypothetical protein
MRERLVDRRGERPVGVGLRLVQDAGALHVTDGRYLTMLERGVGEFTLDLGQEPQYLLDHCPGQVAVKRADHIRGHQVSLLMDRSSVGHRWWAGGRIRGYGLVSPQGWGARFSWLAGGVRASR